MGLWMANVRAKLQGHSAPELDWRPVTVEFEDGERADAEQDRIDIEDEVGE